MISQEAATKFHGERVILVTSASITGGSGPAGGAELFPGLVVKGPQVVLGVSAKPVKPGGAAPSEGLLSLHHCAPQNVTSDPTEALRSPITNAPRDG